MSWRQRAIESSRWSPIDLVTPTLLPAQHGLPYHALFCPPGRRSTALAGTGPVAAVVPEFALAHSRSTGQRRARGAR